MNRYTTIKLARGFSHDQDWDHPIQIISAIRQDPSIVDAIQALEYSPSLPKDWGSDPDEEGPTQEHEQLLASFNYLEDSINDFVFLTTQERSQWKAEARALNRDVCFLILLSMCKYATKLLLVDVYDLPQYFDCILRHMRERLAQPASSEAADGDTSSGEFPRLTELEIAHWDTEGGVDLSGVASMISIPTLTTFTGHMLGSEDSYEDSWTTICSTDVQESMIEEVVLNYSGLSPEALTDLIRDLPHLRTLSYDDRHQFEFSWGIDSERNSWSTPLQYAKILHRIAQDLLQERALEIRLRGHCILVEKIVEGERVDQSLYLSEDDLASDEYRQK